MQAKKRTQILFAALMMSIVILFVASAAARADAPVNAIPLALDGNYSGDKTFWVKDEEAGVADEHMEDIYMVTMPQDGEFEFRIMTFMDNSISYSLWNADMSVNYLDGCGKYVSGGSATSPKTGVVKNVLSAGTYYLKISCSKVDSTKENNKYRLMAKYTGYGVNDYGAYSYDQPLGYTLGTDITGALTFTDKEDWFVVNIPGGKYKLNIQNYCNGSIYFELLNNDLSKTILSSSVYEMKDDATSPTVYNNTDLKIDPGTYYIKIKGGSGKYKFNLRKSSKKQKLAYKITAKRNKKKVTIKTTAGAKVKVTYGGKTYTKTANGSGKVTFKLASKLKRGKKVKVKITKSGYSKISKRYVVK